MSARLIKLEKKLEDLGYLENNNQEEGKLCELFDSYLENYPVLSDNFRHLFEKKHYLDNMCQKSIELYPDHERHLNEVFKWLGVILDNAQDRFFEVLFLVRELLRASPTSFIPLSSALSLNNEDKFALFYHLQADIDRALSVLKNHMDAGTFNPKMKDAFVLVNSCVRNIILIACYLCEVDETDKQDFLKMFDVTEDLKEICKPDYDIICFVE